jgi:hypothetical protein
MNTMTQNLIATQTAKGGLLYGIKNRRLLELAIISFVLFSGADWLEPTKSILQRTAQKGHSTNHRNLVFELEPNDIIAILGDDCSQARAREYIKTLQIVTQ